MQFFKVVRKVLEQLYNDVPEKNRDERIKKALSTLGGTYENILQGAGPDFKDPAIRFAYVYRYTTAHADMMSDLIQQSDALRDRLDAEHVRISCLGGGPGSDLLGFCRSVLKKKDPPSLSFHLIDKEPVWSDAWCDVDLIVSKSLNASKTFVPIDVTDKTSWGAYQKPFQADIFTSLYFLSEIYKMRTKCAPFFEHLFASAKSGAVFAFIDFDHSNVSDWIDGLVAKTKLEPEICDDASFSMSSSENKEELGSFFTKFGYPKLKSKILLRTFVKK